MPERNDMIEQELRGLEAIVADPRLPPRVKMEAIRGYERTLSERVGITLRAMQGVGDVIHNKQLTEKQRIAELKALEDVFVGGARKSLTESGTAFDKVAWRRFFARYVNQHFHVKRQHKQNLRRLAIKRDAKRRLNAKKALVRFRPPKRGARVLFGIKKI